MKAQTLQRLLQLLVTGPLMLKQSGRLKNRYFKIAVGAGGVVLVVMALRDIMQDQQAEKQQAALADKKNTKKLLNILNKNE